MAVESEYEDSVQFKLALNVGHKTVIYLLNIC